MPSKLIVQIPCFNEAATHPPVALAALRRAVAGVDEVEGLVIDESAGQSAGKRFIPMTEFRTFKNG